MTDSPPTAVSTSPPPAAAEPQDPSGLVLKALGAIATGIGILGFVTFFGGAIIWVRLNEAKLPATEAVAVIPHSVLVTTGATFLAPAVATAAGVVAASLVVYLVFNLGVEKGARKRRIDAKTLAHTAEIEARHAAAAVLAAKQARTGGLPEQEVEGLERDAQEKVSVAATAKAHADNEMEAAEITLGRSPWQIRIEAAFGLAALLAIPLLSNRTFMNVDFKWWGLILLLVLALAATITVFVYLETEKFIWFGVAAFVTVGIYIGLSTYVSTRNNVKMQPAAALRTGHDPVYGAFIADTASNLYIGTFGRTHKPPHLLVIPRAQVTELTIGPLLDPHDARNRAISMALEECAQLIEEPATETAPAMKKRACASDQKQALRDAHVK